MDSKLALVIVLAAAGCRASESQPLVRSWGTMREVMREGRTEGRVELAAALDSPGIVGVGALEGLRGEIAIVDGVAWIARVEDGVVCDRGARSADRATLLAISDVEAWREVELAADTTLAEFERFLAAIARGSELGAAKAWPFVVDGELRGVESHVLNGECPYAGQVSPGHEPFRKSLASVHARLVGFYAPESGGELVHHGQALHAHVLVESPEVYVGHADTFEIAAGAKVRIPATSR